MKCSWRSIVIRLLFVGLVLTQPVVGAAAPSASSTNDKPTSDSLGLFSGKRVLIVVNGYSTSFQWWKYLQHKLDRYTGERDRLEVRLAAKAGTPLADWVDVETGEPKKPYQEILLPALKKNEERKVVVLAQQSLQGVFGAREAGIRGPDDAERIALGADAFERYAKRILADGAAAVFVATHIYKKPMEPQIGYERLALAEALRRRNANIFGGPDVWDPTRALYPDVYASDGLHPNAIGAEIMGQLWFETLLRHEGREVPAWSREEMYEAIQDDPLIEPQEVPPNSGSGRNLRPFMRHGGAQPRGGTPNPRGGAAPTRR